MSMVGVGSHSSRLLGYELAWASRQNDEPCEMMWDINNYIQGVDEERPELGTYMFLVLLKDMYVYVA